MLNCLVPLSCRTHFHVPFVAPASACAADRDLRLCRTQIRPFHISLTATTLTGSSLPARACLLGTSHTRTTPIWGTTKVAPQRAAAPGAPTVVQDPQTETANLSFRQARLRVAGPRRQSKDLSAPRTREP